MDSFFDSILSKNLNVPEPWGHSTQPDAMTSSTPKKEVYDLLILVDSTYSMASYLSSLQTSLPQIIQISELTDCFSRIGVLAYRDYCSILLEWSGWLSPSNADIKGQAKKSAADLIKMVKSLKPGAGGDWPEASKTGLAHAYELMRKDAKTIILLYTDAAPHTSMNGQVGGQNSYLGHELKALNDKNSYGGFGPLFADWVSASHWLSGRTGEKKAQVFSILDKHMYTNDANFYNYMSTMTNGASFFLEDPKPASISKVTIEVLLSWMGVEKAGAASADIPALMARYNSVEGIESLKNENDPAADKFFMATAAGRMTEYQTDHVNVTKVPATSEALKDLPKKENPVQDFAKRYNSDPQYKKLAMSIIKQIIEDDVVSISLNPVFGSLWRAVCSDRNSPERDTILAAFGLKVDRIVDPDQKTRMKIWLEESYDYTADVTEAIESVPEAERFPCVFLDPTLVFTREGDNEDDESNKAITDFQRDELLEIGRSCDYKILRRLGRVLTRLTYIKSATEMPAHILAVPETEIPRVPVALAQSKYNRRFWRILLHLVVPGTMLGPRPSALLAALSIRLGIEPLWTAATQEMLLWREKWNNLEIPETWNSSCLGLLMDADKAYRVRQEGGVPVSEVSYCLARMLANFEENECRKKLLRIDPLLTFPKENTLLKPEDRALFQRLVSYKMLEANLDTTLTAQIGWTPEKTRVAIGPTIVCVACEYPRSVTVMGPDNKCGLCIFNELNPPKKQKEHADIDKNVSRDDNETTLAAWVECNLWSCRAQYVVYEVDGLNVKPKCHYCRTGTNIKAPVLECSECLNRIIYPEEYRIGDMKGFKCYACIASRKTTVDKETTAQELSSENTKAWLLRNDGKISQPLNKRSLFKVISEAGTDGFCDKVEIFPDSANRELVLKGKPIRNVPALIKDLESWISRRKTEQGTCSLNFCSRKKQDLPLVCGRSGCSQRACAGCLEKWYGLNAAGRIINTGALTCPFCQRAPNTKTLARHGSGIHTVANLKQAVADKGKWIYAWCRECDHAKQYMERVCAAGAPAELNNWECEQCQASNSKLLKLKKCPGCGSK